MDGRDRDTSARYEDRVPRLRSSDSSRSRRGPTSGFGQFDDDLELSADPPSWEERFGRSRPQATATDRTAERSSRREESRLGAGRPRAGRYPVDDVVAERSSDAIADPYDRLRRVSERRTRRPAEETFEPDPYLGAYDDEPAPVRARVDRRSADAVPVFRRPRPSLPQPQFRAVGAALARSSQDAGALAKLSAAAVASLLALTVLTAARVGSTADWLVVRLDAGGDPSRWGTNESLWRVPLLLVFATVAGLIVAWRLRRHDAFAAQFTVVAVLLLHGFGWVAAGRLLF